MKISKFLQLFKQGKVGAKSHMKNLIEVAMVDGEYDKTEEKLLNGLAKKHRISKKQLQEFMMRLTTLILRFRVMRKVNLNNFMNWSI